MADMSNQEKAKAFMEYMSKGDSRCQLLIMFLSAATGITAERCIANIKELAG